MVVVQVVRPPAGRQRRGHHLTSPTRIMLQQPVLETQAVAFISLHVGKKSMREYPLQNTKIVCKNANDPSHSRYIVVGQHGSAYSTRLPWVFPWLGLGLGSTRARDQSWASELLSSPAQQLTEMEKLDLNYHCSSGWSLQIYWNGLKITLMDMISEFV